MDFSFAIFLIYVHNLFPLFFPYLSPFTNLHWFFLLIIFSPTYLLIVCAFFIFLFLGEYKRLVSNLLSKAEKDKIRRKEYENEHENDETSLSSSIVPLNATNNNEKKDLNNDENNPNLTQLEALELKNEQIKRLIELQTMAAQTGDIPGTYVL